MRKLIPLLIILPALAFLVSACGPKKVDLGPIVDPSIVQEIAPQETATNTETVGATENEGTNINKPSMNCGSDQNCFLNQFLVCAPAEFKIVSSDSQAQISVVGLAGDRCYYFGGVYKDGVLISSGKECRVPLNLISRDTFAHFFGQDNAAGEEGIKIEQDRIEADYCSQI
jgi:hypothetical protein